MDRSAVFLNDAGKNQFTYTVQLPFLNSAYDELKEWLELDNVPMTNAVSANLVLPAGNTSIARTLTTPTYPSDMIDLRGLYERPDGTNYSFLLMDRREFLPKVEVLTAYLQWYTWQGQVIRFVGATGDVELSINYLADNMAQLLNDTSTIDLFNAKSFLVYRNAAYNANFVGENKTRSDELNGMAQLALDRLLATSAKGRQSIATRRRPFMAHYKQRTYW